MSDDQKAIYRELSQRCNGNFIPTKLDDFIGAHSTKTTCGARVVAGLVTKAIAKAKSNGNSPLKFLFNGPPGTGKSAVVAYASHLLGCDKWSIQKLNGTQIKIESIEEVARSVHYMALAGDYKLLWFDEVDEMSRSAQVRALTVLDELPDGVAMICTSNCPLKNFENRFQTRFQAFEFAGPNSAEIETLLARFLKNPAAVKQIATMAGGNVRQALLDVKGVLDSAD